LALDEQFRFTNEKYQQQCALFEFANEFSLTFQDMVGL
jgi:hypothetical protein